MTSILYADIFDNFLGSVTDYDFISLPETQINELMVEKLHKTFSQPYIRRLFSNDSALDDEIATFSYEMEYVVNDNSDKDFVVDILTKGMTVEWLKPQVRSQKYISQMIGTKEEKFFSQQQHLEQIRGLLEDTQLELRKTIRDRGYIYNSYLDG